jgi:hypothetical protein
MPNETRVNLRHLLEDIRDSYNAPIEEVIITELIANALDSGASEIQFNTDHVHRCLTCVDNGNGMRRAALREYHNIASSTKERGRGIGFAGLGTKLALLIAEEVVTETRGGYGSRATTTWRLTSPSRAPWKFIPSTGIVQTSRGTAIRLNTRDEGSPLCDEQFLQYTIQKHFYPLLQSDMHAHLLKYLYKKGVTFRLNGKMMDMDDQKGAIARGFFVRLNARSRRPIGYGYLTRHQETLPMGKSGVDVSTWGKVIKRGWEWLGLLPSAHGAISGIVEVPELAILLTTNKTDFLSDATSLKKYYRLRKAIQNAILPILMEWGDGNPHMAEDQHKMVKPLERQIDAVLKGLVDDFPELESLVGSTRKSVNERKRLVETSETRDESVRGSGEGSVVTSQTDADGQAPVHPTTPDEPKRERASDTETGETKTKRSRKEPGLKIAFEEAEDSLSLGRIAGDVIFVNTAHAAWQKAREQRCETYHVLATVAWTLSAFLEPERAPHRFVSRFLSTWGSGGQQSLKLFQPGSANGIHMNP